MWRVPKRRLRFSLLVNETRLTTTRRRTTSGGRPINFIKEGGPAIKIDGAYEHAYAFQQTGLLKDFNITSAGNIPKTVGIDMRATWSYTIQNVSVMKMGSHGIVFHNNYFYNGTSDGDACHALDLDNVFAYKNGGWGLIVDAGIHGLDW